MRAPYTAFEKTKDVEYGVYQNSKRIDSHEWDDTVWIERGEDWYGLASMGNKRVRVITRENWMRGKEIQA